MGDDRGQGAIGAGQDRALVVRERKREDGGGEGTARERRRSTFALGTAERIAPVAGEAVSVIACFIRRENEIAAARGGAVWAAKGERIIAVERSLVTGFAGIHDPVATRGQLVATIDHTRKDVGETRFALLAEQRLDRTVPADPALQEAVGGAAVEVVPVAVVTLFAIIETRVAAQRRGRRHGREHRNDAWTQRIDRRNGRRNVGHREGVGSQRGRIGI